MTEIGEAPEFEDALGHVEQGLRNGIKQFAVWMASNWKMTREEWIKSFAEPPPQGDYFDGYNAGIESAITACEHFLDENLT